MTIDALIMLMGAFIATLPFLGFPIRIDNIILVVAGVIVISLGIIIRRRSVAARAKRLSSYVESAPRAHGEAHETA